MGNETKRRVRVAVVGGGITGLAAAYYSLKMHREAGLHPEVTLYEASGRLGGKIETLRREGFVIERGPDSFLARKPAIVELARELGLEQELATLNPHNNRTYILHRGKLHRIPAGMVLGVPTRWTALATSGLISPLGKARALLDLMLPPSVREEDETLGGFLRRRLGSEVVERIAEPLLSGIYAGDADRLSLLATFPQFRLAERKHGSLILGFSRGMGASRSGAVDERKVPPHAKDSVFLSFRNGLSTLVEALEERILAGGGTIRIRTPVWSVRPGGAGYTLHLDGHERAEADVVILTVAPNLLPTLLPEVPEADALADMEYASVANVVMVYRKGDLDAALDGTGFLVPRTEGRFITACTWTSSKWPHTAPEDGVVLRSYVGRVDDERWMAMDDEELTGAVRAEIADILGIRAVPRFVDINRLPRSMPQYRVGHLERVAALRRGLERRAPGVYATGSGFEGIGLPDCVRQAEETVRQSVDAFLKSCITEGMSDPA